MLAGRTLESVETRTASLHALPPTRAAVKTRSQGAAFATARMAHDGRHLALVKDACRRVTLPDAGIVQYASPMRLQYGYGAILSPAIRAAVASQHLHRSVVQQWCTHATRGAAGLGTRAAGC
eukprot:775333-Pleurochrysis_carterae.AAC.4